MAFEKKHKKKSKSAPVDCCYEEGDWEAAEDARALGRAAAVNSDPERLARAQKWAKKKLDENKQRREESQALIELGMDAD